ncbi:hypothetical protein NDN08_001278 [Rhodosorus marinus]|uniref:Copper transporter n=1 Tax=Rhodosorus marinus TaxID=101924 RepID=A0AAV8UUJ6_9RHOD|nr:hypothetical protein NDN08_001278 [Rhodosorus marinus]
MKCSCPKISNPVQKRDGRTEIWGNTAWEWGQILGALLIFYGILMLYFYALLQAAYAVRAAYGTLDRPGTDFPNASS